MNKKISFVTTSLVRSGAERVTLLLAEHCLKLGYDVEIIMMLYPTIEFDAPQGIKIVDLSGNTNSRIKRIPYWLKSLKKHFKERKPDVVVSFIARINIFTLLSVKDKNTKVIVSERNDPRHDSRTVFTRFLINRLYPRADAIVFQTVEAKKLFKKKIQNKGVVISNPIHISAYADSEKYDRNLITYAGRYSEQKDVPTIINAAKIVCSKCPDLHFELYGDGPLKENLRQMVNELGLNRNVSVNDNIKDIDAKIHNSFLFVMSSLYEGMSNSLMEASYSGIPCLTTHVLGTHFIKQEKNGYFYEFKNSEQLADLIIKLHTDEKLYDSLRNSSIEIAKNTKHSNTFDEWTKLF